MKEREQGKEPIKDKGGESGREVLPDAETARSYLHSYGHNTGT